MYSYGKILILSAVALVFLVQCGNEPAQPTEQQTSRQENVETGLLPAVIVKGEPSSPLSLTGQMETHGIPAVSVAIINNGKIEWLQGYGTIAPGGRAVDGDTLFRATQISQLVVAMAILRMVETGELDLDQDINEQLISWQFPENEFTRDEKVTLRRILSHTAGIPYMYFRYYSPGDAVPNLLQVLRGEEPATNDVINVTAVPGSQQQLTNAGYAVLQLLIEETTSKGFQRKMRELVLGPAGMERSFFAQRLPEEAENAVMGHDDTGAAQDTIHPELSSIGLWTTANDLARLVIEIQDSYDGQANHVLSQLMTRLMLTPVIGTWGLGPEVRGEADNFYFSIEGHGSCYLCYVVGFPRLGKGAVVLTNASAGEIITSQVLRAIAVEYGWPAFRPREVEPVRLAESQISELAGTYVREGRDDTYELRPVDGKLFLIRENREPKQLLALSPDILIEREFGIEYHAERGEAGEITGITWYIGDRRGFTMIKNK